jgi:Polysaccharide biosynthesis C-terminal domain
LIRITRPSALSVVAVLGLVANVGLTAALTRPLGISGAAIGSVVAYWAYGIAMVLLFSRTSGLALKPLLSGPLQGQPTAFDGRRHPSGRASSRGELENDREHVHK